MFADSTFTPAPALAPGHLMTIYAWARRRAYPGLPTPEIRFIRVDDESQVRADCYWQPNRSSRPTLLGLHGLEGSSDAHYMRGVAHKAWRRGWNAVLLNQRNCGGTEHLTPGLYHSGLTADPVTVLRALIASDDLPSFAVIGYSLGGNLALKLAAELAGAPDVPVTAVAAISPTIDLSLCVDAIEWRQNALYQWHFVQGLKRRMRRKAAAYPGRYDLGPLRDIRTIRQFDDAYTAPCHGFGTAANYYATASARAVIDRIRIPALIIAAENDPFVPASQFQGADIRANSHVRVSLQRHGGHCGFVGRPDAAGDGYWAEEAAVTFVTATVSASRP
jgi:predicted alpha/beta-fold hydrolase